MAQIGISFKPSEEQNQLGPMRAGKEGLQQAIQLLSFRYPKVLGAASPVGDPSLLNGQGPSIGGINPDAAILRALISSLSGGGPMANAGAGGARRRRSFGGMSIPERLPQPSFTPGVGEGGAATQNIPPVSREWAPTQGDQPISAVDPADFMQAAQRSSGGYNTQWRDKFDQLTGNNFY